jgi:DNA modification methylase
MTAIVLRGDARSLPLPDESVDLIVTSPPYFGLRDYRDGGGSLAGQIGAGTTPRAYVDTLLDCTREWIRVLKPGGSLFVNLGDSYANKADGAARATWRGDRADALQGRRNTTGAAPRKSLIGLPWRYALGCIDDLRLVLRAEIIWAKPNGLPESVTDRVRRSHEQLFHFTRQQSYFTAVDEIREEHAKVSLQRAAPHRANPGRAMREGRAAAGTGMPPQTFAVERMNHPLGKLPWSVWEISSQPLAVPDHLDVDHFAAFPMELPRRCILGWSPSGICAACGEGRHPAVASVGLDMSRPQARKAHQIAERAGLTEDHLRALLTVGLSDVGRSAATQHGMGKSSPEVYALADEARSVLGGYSREYLLRRPTSLVQVCACTPRSDHPERRGSDFHAGTDRPRQGMNDGNGGERYRRYMDELANPRAPVREYHLDAWTPAPTYPSVVLDPFGGTGTTALVADSLGRTGISIDRSADYCRLARWRTTDPGERARALQVPKPPAVPDGQSSLLDLIEPAS